MKLCRQIGILCVLLSVGLLLVILGLPAKLSTRSHGGMIVTVNSVKDEIVKKKRTERWLDVHVESGSKGVGKDIMLVLCTKGCRGHGATKYQESYLAVGAKLLVNGEWRGKGEFLVKELEDARDPLVLQGTVVKVYKPEKSRSGTKEQNILIREALAGGQIRKKKLLLCISGCSNLPESLVASNVLTRGATVRVTGTLLELGKVYAYQIDPQIAVEPEPVATQPPENQIVTIQPVKPSETKNPTALPTSNPTLSDSVSIPGNGTATATETGTPSPEPTLSDSCGVFGICPSPAEAPAEPPSLTISVTHPLNVPAVKVISGGSSIYAATTQGVYVSTNGGSLFARKTAGLGSQTVVDLAYDSNKLYALTTGGLSILPYGGATFVNHPITYTVTDGTGTHIKNADPRAMYVSSNNIYVATDVGLFISYNDGTTFNIRNLSSGLGHVSWQSCYDNGSGQQICEPSHEVGTPDSTSVVADGSNIYVAASYGGTAGSSGSTSGLSVSHDGGNTFTHFYKNNSGFGDSGWTSTRAMGLALFKGEVLLATTEGFQNFNPVNNQFGIINGMAGRPEISIYARAADIILPGTPSALLLSDMILIGTPSGLRVSVDGGDTFMQIGKANGLSSDDVRYAEVIGGKIFIATAAGVDAMTRGNPPLEPNDLDYTVDTDNRNVTLSWSAIDGASEYHIYRDGVLISKVTTPGFFDTGLMHGQSYAYDVSAVGMGGESAKVRVDVFVDITTPPLAPPSNPVVGATSNSSIELSWGALADADEYAIYRDGEYYASTADTSFTDSGLLSGMGYRYEIRAVNSYGESGEAATLFGQTSGAPGIAPQNFKAEIKDSPWAGASSSSPWVVLTFDPIATAAGYKIYRNGKLLDNIMDGFWVGNTFYNRNLPEGSISTYTICAFNNSGDGPNATAQAALCTPPSDSPSAVKYKNVDIGQIRLSWKAAAGIDSYAVFKDGLQVGTISGETSFLDSGVLAGNNYQYQVGATSGDCVGPLTSPLNVAGVGVSAEPPPANFVANMVALDSGPGAALSWDRPNSEASISGYSIWRIPVYSTGQGAPVLVSDGSTDVQFDSRLVDRGPSTTNTIYRIKALYPDGVSAPVDATVTVPQVSCGAEAYLTITLNEKKNASGAIEFSTISSAILATPRAFIVENSDEGVVETYTVKFYDAANNEIGSHVLGTGRIIHGEDFSTDPPTVEDEELDESTVEFSVPNDPNIRSFRVFANPEWSPDTVVVSNSFQLNPAVDSVCKDICTAENVQFSLGEGKCCDGLIPVQIGSDIPSVYECVSCGDGVCGPKESSITCPEDCGA